MEMEVSNKCLFGHITKKSLQPLIRPLKKWLRKEKNQNLIEGLKKSVNDGVEMMNGLN